MHRYQGGTESTSYLIVDDAFCSLTSSIGDSATTSTTDGQLPQPSVVVMLYIVEDFDTLLLYEYTLEH